MPFGRTTLQTATLFQQSFQRQAIDAAFRSYICSLAMSRPISLQVQTCKQKLRETGRWRHMASLFRKANLTKKQFEP
jgi:hypothetical protein